MRCRLKPFWKQLVIDYLQLFAQVSLPRRMMPGRIPLVRIIIRRKKAPYSPTCCGSYQLLKDFVKLFCFFFFLFCFFELSARVGMYRWRISVCHVSCES